MCSWGRWRGDDQAPTARLRRRRPYWYCVSGSKPKRLGADIAPGSCRSVFSGEQQRAGCLVLGLTRREHQAIQPSAPGRFSMTTGSTSAGRDPRKPAVLAKRRCRCGTNATNEAYRPRRGGLRAGGPRPELTASGPGGTAGGDLQECNASPFLALMLVCSPRVEPAAALSRSAAHESSRSARSLLWSACAVILVDQLAGCLCCSDRAEPRRRNLLRRWREKAGALVRRDERVSAVCGALLWWARRAAPA